MSVFPFPARPPSFTIARVSLIYHHYHSRSQCSYIHPNPLFWDQGGSQSGFPNRRSSSTEKLLFNCGKRSMSTAALPTPPAPSFPEILHASPTESYMQLSAQSSHPLEDPTASRKLLVLDLNRTLLRRGAYLGVGIPRPLYARPYLPSFLAYIFHPTTLKWLDTMVWSSLERRNMDGMVDEFFGTYKKSLKAVWARDALELSIAEYYVKDLARPWAQIPSLVSTHPNSEVDADRDSLPSVPQQRHSVLTTILMNDLPLEAVLQPWNHLCISEYGEERRELDVQIAEREKFLLANKQQLELQGAEEEESFDELLLAVIGILDALKHEGNVAGWMRSGGLVRVVGGNQETISESPETETPVITTTTKAGPSTPTFAGKNSVLDLMAELIGVPTQSPRLWYEIPSVLSHWAQLGRKALAELGIDIIHGVAPVPEIPSSSHTDSYMQLSLQSSLRLADPIASRKLLVLDPNGTLLLRSAHISRGAARPLYARPYLPSFLAYIFHPTTLQWLDTMVWSSLERRNTHGMVDECFGTYKEGLKAVWARDTFGLSDDEYCTKTQIIKDLDRLWAQIPSLISNQSHRPENPNFEVNADRDYLLSVLVNADRDYLLSGLQQQHSALTTILMDNFHRNSVLQPWNHLRVSNYGEERWELDVRIAERVQREKLLLAKRQQLEVRRYKKIEREEESFDELLLAVIGILDALKHEGNVAGWMRNVGLPCLWYEIPSVLSHWAQHGRKALAELGIDIIHGIKGAGP